MSRDTREWRPFTFFTVLLVHGLVVLTIFRASPPTAAATHSRNPLLLLIFEHDPRTTSAIAPLASVLPRTPSLAPRLTPKVTSVPAAAAQEPPAVDWEKEVGVAARAAVDDASKENDYRNLAGLSSDQLSWVRQNQLTPAKPGIPWKYRTVEVTPGGFPIIHINDHCVAIPFLMMMVFCKIGHIEPNGGLFDSLREPE